MAILEHMDCTRPGHESSPGASARGRAEPCAVRREPAATRRFWKGPSMI